jgi:hypothetical protein
MQPDPVNKLGVAMTKVGATMSAPINVAETLDAITPLSTRWRPWTTSASH